MIPTKEYAVAINKVLTANNASAHIIIDRLDVLEKYCYQMRGK